MDKNSKVKFTDIPGENAIERFDRHMKELREATKMTPEEEAKWQKEYDAKVIKEITDAFEKNGVRVLDLHYSADRFFDNFECFVTTPRKKLRLKRIRGETFISSKVLFFWSPLLFDSELMTPEWKAAHPGSEKNPYIRPSLYEMIRAVRFKLGAKK